MTGIFKKIFYILLFFDNDKIVIHCVCMFYSPNINLALKNQNKIHKIKETNTEKKLIIIRVQVFKFIQSLMLITQIRFI